MQPTRQPTTALIAGAPLYEFPPAKKPAKADAANTPEVDRSLPTHLPREAKVYRPEARDDHHDAKGQACGCTACGGRLRLIGQDISEQLEYVPAHYKVIRHVRPKLACVACQAIFQAAAPSQPIARGIAGPRKSGAVQVITGHAARHCQGFIPCRWVLASVPCRCNGRLLDVSAQ